MPEEGERVDMVISCMVMEHMESDAETAYMQISKRWLNERGLMVGLVPASPAHWGIEDDIAGHCRRYTTDRLRTLSDANGWHLRHVAGLTFPISNLLLPVSNYLVDRTERSKMGLSAQERTRQSGRRNVKYKTRFPAMLRVILNRYTLYPLYLLQKVFSTSERALVLYFEANPISGGADSIFDGSGNA